MPIMPDFDPKRVSAAEWAFMYRAAGLQVIPCWVPGERGSGASWKRPKLGQWKEFLTELVPQPVFDRWYRLGGEHAQREQMGIITGPCSGNRIVVDLDIHKNPAALAWWNAVLEVENSGIEPETVEQRTGGGGLQKLFRAPPGYHVPTCRTDRGVDIRGSSGFAVMPPSLHESGQHYAWMPGAAPWERDIADAPVWLLEAIEQLVDAHGGDQSGAPKKQRTASPEGTVDAFGRTIDGREEKMRNVVWRSVLEWRRECPIKPPEDQWRDRAEAAYEVYERNTETRIPGMDRRAGLEREGRGPSEFWKKFRREMLHWDSPKLREEADKPPPSDGVSSADFDPRGGWRKASDFDPRRRQEEPPKATQNGFDPSDFADAEAQPQEPPRAAGSTKPGLILTASQFLAGFQPPDYVIDGIVQRSYLYSLTAKTNHGKTAVALYIAQAIARGEQMHGRPTLGGTVLFLAGENSQDIRARLLVLAEAYAFDPELVKIRFIDGVINIAEKMAEIVAAAMLIDDLVLVIVDTAAAYFLGDEGNSNAQQAAFAQLLRELTKLRGRPMVLVNCHPVKNAARDNLLPMGGSAFVNEVDGNLVLWAEDKLTTLHWQGKFRGPEFEPLTFELKGATSERAKDSKGRLMTSVVAHPISDQAKEAGAQAQESDENNILMALYANPRAAFARLAELCGLMVDGRPNKSRVQRLMKSLLADKMVEQYRNGRYRITRKGCAEIGETYQERGPT